ncbi:hypothetical protein GTQ45_02065 [Pyruvatibacter mobilis]|uniref:Uncharacterized protein n=1 Tax=Pyruvatibacter mobilis TaxID=1712261 RepID=A0A845Q7W3_9HYPH|nr:hypothetical protein [Pyruvatibacter mobilis]QJD76700.1 hypothetical protein HG718_00615 [Pyruvatibacter mobilis]
MDAAGDYDLEAFIKGYLDALFFTNTGEEDDALPAGATVDDFAPETAALIRTDCTRFVADHGNLLVMAERWAEAKGFTYTAEQAGIDLWFTRNGHGVGYWDRGLGPLGDVLADLCGYGTEYPPLDPYVGDDGNVYLF